MIYRLYVKSANTDLIYESEMELKSFFEKNRLSIEFPGLFFSDDNIFESNYKVVYKNTNNRKIEFDENTCSIEYPISEINQSSIAYMGYVLLEKQRAEQHSLTAHCACVDYNGNGVLILGKEGSGKTTTAINLCKSFNASLVANDLSIIDYTDQQNIKVLDGTKFLFLRKESIKRNLPELLEKFGEDKIDSWLNKVKVMPADVGIKTATGTNLKRAFIVHVDNEQKQLHVTSGDTMVNKLYLNEIFQKYIRNTCTTFLNKDYNPIGFVPSFDCPKFYKERVGLINCILDDMKLEYVSGNVGDVSEYIDTQMCEFKIIGDKSGQKTPVVEEGEYEK